MKAEIVLAAAVTKSKRVQHIFVPRQMEQQLKRFYQSFARAADTATYSVHKRTHTSQPIQHLQRLCQRVATVSTTIHSVRGTWLTELSSKGVGVRVLAAMACYASIHTTQRYIDVNDEQMRKTMESV